MLATRESARGASVSPAVPFGVAPLGWAVGAVFGAGDDVVSLSCLTSSDRAWPSPDFVGPVETPRWADCNLSSSDAGGG